KLNTTTYDNNESLNSELDLKRLERHLLFYTVYLNRLCASNQLEAVDEQESIVNVILDYVDLSVSCSLSSLSYFQFNETFMLSEQLDFTTLMSNNTNNSLYQIHFYDLIQIFLLRFICSISEKKESSSDTMIYLLCNNLTLNMQSKYLM